MKETPSGFARTWIEVSCPYSKSCHSLLTTEQIKPTLPVKSELGLHRSTTSEPALRSQAGPLLHPQTRVSPSWQCRHLCKRPMPRCIRDRTGLTTVLHERVFAPPAPEGVLGKPRQEEASASLSKAVKPQSSQRAPVHNPFACGEKDSLLVNLSNVKDIENSAIPAFDPFQRSIL